MGFILQILAAILVAFGLAIVVVKYLPLKFRWIASVLLLLFTFLLVSKIYNGIMEPINFNKEKVVRFAKIVQKLKIIRNAEIRHYEVTGNYSKDKAGLIQFIDSSQLALTEVRDTVIKVNKGSRWAPLMVDVEKRIKDTIGYEPVLKYFKDVDYKTMFIVPGVDNKEFELEIGTVEKIQGLIVPTFEARTEKKEILKGLNNSLVKLELEAMASDQIKGEYVSVGSLDEVTTGGNWPPSYDKKREKKDN